MTCPPCCLSISISDTTGADTGQADLKTFTALGTFGVLATTGIRVQDSAGIHDTTAMTERLVHAQLDAVEATHDIRAVKVGFCPSAATIRVIGRWLRERPLLPVVVDPILLQHHGIPLQQPEVISALQQELLPRATVATPNRFEAARLSGMDECLTRDDMEQAARAIFQQCGCTTVVTGGGLGDESLDVACGFDGISHFSLPSEGSGDPVLGAGCSYSAALTAQLARGEALRESLLAAKSYVTELIAGAQRPRREIPVRVVAHCQAIDSLAQADGVGISTGRFEVRGRPAS